MKSRVHEAKNHISDLEYKEAKNTQSEQQKENRIQKSDDSVSSFWNNFKSTSVLIMGVLGGERESEKLKTYLKK